MTERFKYLRPVGAITAAAAFTFGPTTVDSATDFGSDSKDSANHLNADEPFLDQFDQFAETDYGKLITYSLLVYSFAGFIYAARKGKEIDDDRKFKERMVASSALVALGLNLVAQSYTESDSLLTASMLTVYVLAQSAYNYENLIQADRSLGKRLPGYATICAMLLSNGAVLAETINKY